MNIHSNHRIYLFYLCKYPHFNSRWPTSDPQTRIQLFSLFVPLIVLVFYSNVQNSGFQYVYALFRLYWQCRFNITPSEPTFSNPSLQYNIGSSMSSYMTPSLSSSIPSVNQPSISSIPEVQTTTTTTPEKPINISEPAPVYTDPQSVSIPIATVASPTEMPNATTDPSASAPLPSVAAMNVFMPPPLTDVPPAPAYDNGDKYLPETLAAGRQFHNTYGTPTYLISFLWYL